MPAVMLAVPAGWLRVGAWLLGGMFTGWQSLVTGVQFSGANSLCLIMELVEGKCIQILLKCLKSKIQLCTHCEYQELPDKH